MPPLTHAEQRVGDRPDQARRGRGGHQPPPRVGQRAGREQHRDPPGGQQPADDDDLPAVPPELPAHLVDPVGVLPAGHPAHRGRATEAADREGDQVAGERAGRGDQHDERQRELVGASWRRPRRRRRPPRWAPPGRSSRAAPRRTSPGSRAGGRRSSPPRGRSGRGHRRGRATRQPGLGHHDPVSRPSEATAAANARGGSTSSRAMRERRGAGQVPAPASERAPVHRDGDPRPHQRDGLRGAERVEVARARASGPSPSTGSSATSTPRRPRSAMPSNRSVSPAA